MGSSEMATRRVRKDPVPLTWRKVPASLGRGRVALYDRRQGLPMLLAELPAVGDVNWCVVHFPSRRSALLKSKKLALNYLGAVADGTDELGLCTESQPESAPKPKPHARAIKTDFPEVVESAQTPAPEVNEPPPQKATNEDGTTVVPEGMTFDQAMQSVFSAQRITGELERLLKAEKTWVSSEGDMQSAPDYAVQLNTVKTIISYHQGRPPEKEKPPKEKPKVSLDELKSLLLTSGPARNYMRNLLAEVDAATDATNPAPPAVKIAKLREDSKA